MHYFEYKHGRLFAESVDIRRIAEDVGTPFYLYSYATLRRHYEVFDTSFSKVDHLVCFSVKSNSNLAILRTFISLGSGMDVVSGGELFRALKAGADPSKIVFSGVGKTPQEMRYGLENRILLFNVESEQELYNLNQVSAELGLVAPVALRVNPDIDPQTHPYISTGLKKNKFGIQIEQSIEVYKKARALPNVDPVGVHCHIGSQLVEIAPFVDTLQRVVELIKTLRSLDIEIRYLDFGGGLGITYEEESPPQPKEYAEALVQEASGTGCVFILEPGRVLVGNAGILVTRVQYIKRSASKTFIIVDAAMNDCIRPSLYGSYQAIWPVTKRAGEPFRADVVGPICESGDFLAKDRLVASVEPGDLIAVMSTGAYGFSMSSNYNSRPRVAEVLVHGDSYSIIRSRETYQDLVRGESIPAFLA
jgi:diaminopimelate decarboxylase